MAGDTLQLLAFHDALHAIMDYGAPDDWAWELSGAVKPRYTRGENRGMQDLRFTVMTLNVVLAETFHTNQELREICEEGINGLSVFVEAAFRIIHAGTAPSAFCDADGRYDPDKVVRRAEVETLLDYAAATQGALAALDTMEGIEAQRRREAESLMQTLRQAAVMRAAGISAEEISRLLGIGFADAEAIGDTGWLHVEENLIYRLRGDIGTLRAVLESAHTNLEILLGEGAPLRRELDGLLARFPEIPSRAA